MGQAYFNDPFGTLLADGGPLWLLAPDKGIPRTASNHRASSAPPCQFGCAV
jgi:hypothetical protein